MPTQPSSYLRSYADVAVSWRSPLFEHQASRQALALEKYPHTFRPAMVLFPTAKRAGRRCLARSMAPGMKSSLANFDRWVKALAKHKGASPRGGV